ncbi:hypothetical protein VP01_1409g3 [Puccinia sorghi]|uniref:Uncharacterized protein n=1 Tax=Puccinia sorghi TaxID=27349 RepID=A0A0L6VLE8_9BASI|nr:hypothetical protein VP01_1409g3 [Puccinia sorghi]
MKFQHTYKQFIEKVASESNKRFAGPLMRDATRTGVPPIEWHIYLLQSRSLPKFRKASQCLITNQASFTIQNWDHSLNLGTPGIFD